MGSPPQRIEGLILMRAERGVKNIYISILPGLMKGFKDEFFTVRKGQIDFPDQEHRCICRLPGPQAWPA
jgi:hypothetical protein